MEQTLSGGSVVRMVTIEVGNPGGISTSSTAAATVNGLACSGDGTFTAKLEETVTADHGGEIASMAVEEGSYVHEGATLFTYTQESADDALQTVQDSLETAEQSVEDAESELENTQDSLEDYEITAPISGQVIVKNTKAGDTLNSGGDSNTAMAIIYDMSALTFDMYVDELDVLDVEVGQKVEVTVDAFEGETFTGQVTNVSLESTSSNGVTQYPVTVQMDEVGDLLPGMNVNGEIIIDEAENALAIPAQALQRGNVVYVQDDSVTEAQG
ncbi:MAG: efflux RND transporter periplasmic adaptor subunit, partial [Anaeromassilibacillus sp.]